MQEAYVSVDIEADGPIPGRFSMLSLGAVAFQADGKEIGFFSANLNPLVGAGQDSETMNWWSENKEAWNICQKGARPAKEVMQEFADWLQWLQELDYAPAFVGYPVTFDFMFVYWYLMAFVGYSAFSFSGIDIKTLAMVLLKKDFRKIGKRTMPHRWFSKRLNHKHVAVDDAREQGEMFIRMLKESRT